MDERRLVNAFLDRPVKTGWIGEANYHRRIDIAFICTGNICRSPMAEGLLRARLAGVAPRLVVGSAGLLFDGREAEPHAIKTLKREGVDIRGHRSQRIEADLFEGCSLILGMERKHVREVANLDPSLFARSFTLPEFTRAAALVGPRDRGVRLRDWAEHIASFRSAADYSYADPASEIRDPYGMSGRAYRECASIISARLDELVELAWPPVPTDGAAVPHATSGGIHADRDRR